MVRGTEPGMLQLNRTELEKLGPAEGDVMDAILPWMKGFEKRYHPEEHEYDIVKCICGFSCPDSEVCSESSSFKMAWLMSKETREMVQCDQCSLWQHIPCLKIKKDDIPLDYVQTNTLWLVSIANTPSFVTIVYQSGIYTSSVLPPNLPDQISRLARRLGQR